MKNKYQVEDLQLKSEQRSKSLTINSMQKSVTSLSLILLGAGITVGTGYLTSRAYSPNNSGASNPAAISAAAIPGTATAQSSQPSAVPNGLNFIADVARQVSPAVVKINSSRTVASQGGDSFNNPQLRQFFGFPPPEQGRQVERGSGSGFIVNANGRILTNAHVVDGADKVSVILNDGRRFDGKVLGSDPVTDLAVVQVEATNLPTVSIGNSDQLQPGEWAIAIGNPLGLDHTVTKGIISAIGRSSSDIGEGNKRIDFIQTDAAINPGNSGGALLNSQGELIGINTAIFTGSRGSGSGNIGIGFAINIDRVQPFIALAREGRAAQTPTQESRIAGSRRPPEPITLNSRPVTGNISRESNVLSSDNSFYNIHSFEGRQGQRVEIEMSSQQFVPYLFLLNPDSQVLTQTENVPPNSRTIRLSAVLPRNGTYLILANTSTEGEIGNYNLRASVGGSASTPTPTTPPPTGRVILREQGMLDRQSARVLESDGSLYRTYNIQGREGQTITIDLSSPDFDTFLALLDEQGQVIDKNDDVNDSSTNSQLVVTLPRNGTYRIIVNALEASGQGRFTLIVR